MSRFDQSGSSGHKGAAQVLNFGQRRMLAMRLWFVVVIWGLSVMSEGGP
jgi:hypothetical protein